MNITVTDQDNCKKQLRLEIPAETVRAETDKIAANLARQVNVAGFRRGHVPTSVVKTRFRKELRDEMLSHLLPHALADAIREKDLRVVGEPAIDDLKFGDDESIDVTFTLEVAPEFEISNYKSLPLTKRVYKVRDEDVEKTIGRIRESQAELVPVEDRPAQDGDILTLNITGRFDAKADAGQGDQDAAAETQEPEGEKSDPIEDAKADSPEEIKQQDVEIQLGAEGVLKEFADALAGARAGDTRTFSIDYPADYSGKEYAGRRVSYEAEVTAIRVKELPEVDDEFAQSVGEEFKTADQLRTQIRSNLEQEVTHKSEDELRAAVMQQLVESNRFDVPGFIVERQMDSRLNGFVRQLASQGVDPRRMKVDWEGLRESQRERAEQEVRGSFILERIASSESIDVSEDELNQELERIAEGTGQTVEALRARLTKEEAVDSIREQVKNRKALDLVIASADIREEEVEGLEREKAATGTEGERTEG